MDYDTFYGVVCFVAAILFVGLIGFGVYSMVVGSVEGQELADAYCVREGFTRAWQYDFFNEAEYVCVLDAPHPSGVGVIKYANVSGTFDIREVTS